MDARCQPAIDASDHDPDDGDDGLTVRFFFQPGSPNDTPRHHGAAAESQQAARHPFEGRLTLRRAARRRRATLTPPA